MTVLMCAQTSPRSARLEIVVNLFPLASDIYAAKLYRSIAWSQLHLSCCLATTSHPYLLIVRILEVRKVELKSITAGHGC